MDEIKLKPCPFCGGPGVLRTVGKEWYVECGNRLICNVSPWTVYTTSAEEAAEHWNRRAEHG